MRKLKKIILNDNVEILGRSELRYIVGAATYGDTDCIWALCMKKYACIKNESYGYCGFQNGNCMCITFSI